MLLVKNVLWQLRMALVMTHAAMLLGSLILN